MADMNMLWGILTVVNWAIKVLLLEIIIGDYATIRGVVRVLNNFNICERGET